MRDLLRTAIRELREAAGRVVGRLALGFAAVTVALRIAKVNAVSKNLGRAALVAFLVLPVADLKPTAHDDHAPLAEILLYELSRTAPRNNVDKIRFPLRALRRVIAVAGDGEGDNRRAALRSAKLWVTRQTSHENNAVKHDRPPALECTVLEHRCWQWQR